MAIRKIVFVGIHYKPGLEALDSRTKTGKIIDLIINQVGNIPCEKTNLFPTDYLPICRNCQQRYVSLFEFEEDALYVGLGKRVNCQLEGICNNHVPVYHPAWAIRMGQTESYIQSVLEKIGTARYMAVNI